jgi:homopolymeric O-antigen transport system permease protein
LTNAGVQELSTLGRSLETPLEWPEERLIKPCKRRVRIRDLVGDLAVVRVLAARDLKVKYKQSLLGPLWLFFQPLALLAGFLVAFQHFAGVKVSGQPYAVFVLVGLSAWSYFQAAMTIGTASLVTNMNLVRYTPCPRLAFLSSSVISSLPTYAVTATGAFVATAATGHLSARVLLLPVVLLWLALLTLACIAILGTLTVRYRDVTSALPFLLQVGVFLAPVGYPLSQLSPGVRAIVELNPIAGVIEASRWVMLSGYKPAVTAILVALGVTAVLAAFAWWFFSLRETTMADDI